MFQCRAQSSVIDAAPSRGVLLMGWDLARPVPGGLSMSGALLGVSLGLDSVQVNLGAALWGSALAVMVSWLPQTKITLFRHPDPVSVGQV